MESFIIHHEEGVLCILKQKKFVPKNVWHSSLSKLIWTFSIYRHILLRFFFMHNFFSVIGLKENPSSYFHRIKYLTKDEFLHSWSIKCLRPVIFLILALPLLSSYRQIFQKVYAYTLPMGLEYLKEAAKKVFF